MLDRNMQFHYTEPCIHLKYCVLVWSLNLVKDGGRENGAKVRQNNSLDHGSTVYFRPIEPMPS